MKAAKYFAEETMPVLLPETAGLEVNEAQRPAMMAKAKPSRVAEPVTLARPRLLARRLARQARRAVR